MKKLKLIGQCLLLCGLFGAGAVQAAPRITVSVPAVHSLVSALMQGAGQPHLLRNTVNGDSAELDIFEKSHLITADLLIWVGEGLDSSLADTFERMPALRHKALTLSRYTPTLGRTDYQHRDPRHDRVPPQQARDLAFWTDPRLAIHAVRMITPRLVRLDPEHQDLYLDNEIALIKRLRGLEAEIAALLPADGVLAQSTRAAQDPYFVHRFAIATADGGMLQKVSGTLPAGCSAPLQGAIESGSEGYFTAMRQLAAQAAACMQTTGGMRTASSQSADSTRGEI